MSEVRLRLKEPTAIPIEAEAIKPDQFAALSAAEIAILPIFHGNEKCALGDLFAVEGERSDHVRLGGDGTARVKYAGQGMRAGRLVIEGDAGMHTGAEMRGGEIVVEGSAGDWLGAEMRGGTIRVRGNAGHQVGAAYRGSRRGMNGGTIYVHGNAGQEVGARMRRGLIVIGGDAGDFAGLDMIAGTIIVFGALGLRPGAGMRRGTIVTMQPPGNRNGRGLLPTFRADATYRPVFLRLYLTTVRAAGFEVRPEWLAGPYRHFHGDLNSLGKGEILVYGSDE